MILPYTITNEDRACFVCPLPDECNQDDPHCPFYEVDPVTVAIRRFERLLYDQVRYAVGIVAREVGRG